MPSWGRSEGVIVARGDGAYHEPGRGRLAFSPAPGDKGTALENVVAVEPAAFGQWFVLTGKPARVLLYDRKLSYVRKLMDQTTSEPVDITRDRLGHLYVLDRKAGAVHRFAASGDLAARLSTGGLRKPIGVAVDGAGNVYVLDRDTRKVEILDPNGQRLDSLGPVLPGGRELKRPVDVTVDGAGRIFLIEDKPAGLLIVE